MKRTQVQLDESTYYMLRKQAFERGTSVSAVLREAVSQYLIGKRRPLRMEDFSYIGMGHSDDGDLAPVSENHDEALARARYDEIIEKGAAYDELLKKP